MIGTFTPKLQDTQTSLTQKAMTYFPGR